jgi:hypothetical protein
MPSRRQASITRHPVDQGGPAANAKAPARHSYPDRPATCLETRCRCANRPDGDRRGEERGRHRAERWRRVVAAWMHSTVAGQPVPQPAPSGNTTASQDCQELTFAYGFANHLRFRSCDKGMQHDWAKPTMQQPVPPSHFQGRQEVGRRASFANLPDSELLSARAVSPSHGCWPCVESHRFRQTTHA